MEISPVRTHPVIRMSHTEREEFDDQLAVEEPLEIRIAYRPGRQKFTKSISVTMRTPGNDAELAAGFLFTEGIIHSKDQIADINTSVLGENRIVVTCPDDFEPQLGSLERNFYTTSSCGVCGKASIDAIQTRSIYETSTEPLALQRKVLFHLMEQLTHHQDVFGSTGGLHASALFDFEGNFEALREDVGRHNALDKLIGSRLLLHGLPLKDRILLLSGRASFELIQKAAMAGIRVVAAIGAPSSLAVQLAEDSRIILIGFLKKDRFNIYTGSDRLQLL